MINLNITITEAEAKEQLETSLIIIGTPGITADAKKLNEKIIHLLVRSLHPHDVDASYSFSELFLTELQFSFEGTLVKTSFESFAEFLCEKM